MTTAGTAPRRDPLRWVSSTLAALLLGIGCFSLSLPERAQIRCSGRGDWCPDPWECCGDGLCRPKESCDVPHCEGSGGYCKIENAVDCATSQICSDSCWTPCASCGAVCESPDYQRCQIEGTEETWPCHRQQICVVREKARLEGVCFEPSPQCAGVDRYNCSCLMAPFAISRPCVPGEACDHASYRDCVACRLEERTVDAGATRGDADSTDTDIAVISPPDGTPECFESLGVNEDGDLCCNATTTEGADFNTESSSFECSAEELLVAECDGYGAACMDVDAIPECSGPGCLYAWEGLDGQLHCAADGPASPCGTDNSWECVAGSEPPANCDCIADACSP